VPLSLTCYICPECNSALPIHDNGGYFRCERCGAAWPLVDSVPVFTRNPTYWKSAPRELLSSLLDSASNSGWRTAITHYAESEGTGYTEKYMIDEGRGDWFLFVASKARPDVLDIGAGYGAISIALSKWSNMVVSTDLNLESSRLLRLRARESGCENVRPVVTGPLGVSRLPFATESFDIVVMNGVLEWVGLADLSRPVRDVQLDALLEAKRVLAPGGRLYVGIENRLSWSVIRGDVGHQGIRYLDAMPRVISNWICKRMGIQEGFRAHTYTPLGYSKLLARAGFRITMYLHLFPTYRDPDFACPAHQRGAVRFISTAYSRGLKRLGLRVSEIFGLDRYLVYGVGLLAERM